MQKLAIIALIIYALEKNYLQIEKHYSAWKDYLRLEFISAE